MVKMSSYLNYSKISGGFPAFSRISTKLTSISRLVKDSVRLKFIDALKHYQADVERALQKAEEHERAER